VVTIRLPLSFSLLAALLLEAGSAAAAGEGADDAPLRLRIEASGVAVNERSVRQAIVRELRLDDDTDTDIDDPIVDEIALRVVPGGELTVTIHAGTGQALSRSVATPARMDEVPEVTALLVGNLARDEASGLLARLRAPAEMPSEPSPAKPSPAKRSLARRPAAEPASPSTPTDRPPLLPLDGVNVSLAYPLTLRERTDERRFALELGLFYSRIGALSGVAIELWGVAHVLGPVHGVMLGGLGYWHGGPAEGLRVATLFGVGGNSLEGASVAGITTVERGGVSGVQLSTFVNVAEGDVDGVQATGLMNVARSLEGAQLSAAANLANDVDGVQLGALANWARGDVEGVQLSYGVNIARRLNGVQLSLVNVGGDVDGAQIGLVNVARDVAGLQLGLVNVAREVDGVSLAYVPYSERGRTQGVVWAATSMPINLGVRFHTGPLYVMPTVSYDPRSGATIIDPINGDYAPGLAFGHRFDIDRGFLDADVHYSNRSTGSDYGETVIDLRYRLLAGLQVTRAFGLFAGGGLRHHFRTQGSGDQFVKPELSVGVQLL
jgi:hypothetical protein